MEFIHQGLKLIRTEVSKSLKSVYGYICYKTNWTLTYPNVVRVITSRRMRWAGHVARIEEGRGVYRGFGGETWGKETTWGDPGVHARIILGWIWCDFDRASSLICGNKMPTRCNRGFYLQQAVYRGWRYQRLWWYNLSSWGWAACCSKHVEDRSVTYILLKNKGIVH